MNFAGKVALITGGGNGIGRAACVAFADLGAKVVVIDNDIAAADETVEIIRKSGYEALSVKADVTKSSEVRTYVSAAIDSYGQIDCFFNNAGIGGRIAHAVNLQEADFDAVIDINVKGVFLGLHHVLPHMIERGQGAIVNTASAAALVPTPGMCAYVASKQAVIGLTRTVAGEVANLGVRVNAVLPGPVDTRAMRWLEEQLAPAGASDEISARTRAAQPTGRYSTPAEVANVVLFLCSDLASNVTGAQFSVDGGRSATGGASNQSTR